MANVYHTVVRGDTLSELAVKYNTTVANLVKLNDITDPDYIVVGQVLLISGTPTTDKDVFSDGVVRTNRVKIKAFGLQSNTDRTVYATWNWTKSNTDHYRVRWWYYTGDGVGFLGDDSETKNKQSTYNAPDNAISVKFYVKAVSKKHKVNKIDVSYWEGGWSEPKTYKFSNNPPEKPSAPSVELNGNKLTMRVDGLATSVEKVEFYVVKNDKSKFLSKTVSEHYSSASYTCTITPGYTYKVRCRAIKKKDRSDWSDYSSVVETIPPKVSLPITLKAISSTEVKITWPKIANVNTFDIQYAERIELFASNQAQSENGVTTYTYWIIGGLETGKTYYFRIRAVNNQGSSAWTMVPNPISIGKKPSAPTTWSNTTTVIAGEPLILYWVHNSVDGSSQTKAELELTIDGVKTIQTITNTTNEDEKDKTSSETIDTTKYKEGTTIEWRVRTKGVVAEYGDWSVLRKVDVYAKPSLSLELTDIDGNEISVLNTFPLNVYAIPSPDTQTPIGYHVSIVSNEFYENDVDDYGEAKVVNAGEEIFSKYYDIKEALNVSLGAGDLDLFNGITYKIKCIVSMSSGLTAEQSGEFTVTWDAVHYTPDCELGVDLDDLTAYILPFCRDENEKLVENITLSVYRREYDGTFTEVIKDIENDGKTYVNDPHPALDYARYRIVARDTTTGTITYYDPPGRPVNEKAVIIQWGENWRKFEVETEDILEEPPWAGQMLRLPYNIDVSDDYSPDVTLVEYVGRRHPVSYYGTHVGETAKWNVEIDKNDVETLYMIRKLAIWMGDVYVREPSGSGYWANIKVSFSQKYSDLTIPISFSITRVSGGL